MHIQQFPAFPYYFPMVNVAAQPERLLRRGDQVPRQAESKGGLDAETHYGARISPTAGLATAWVEEHLGTARICREKRSTSRRYRHNLRCNCKTQPWKGLVPSLTLASSKHNNHGTGQTSPGHSCAASSHPTDHQTLPISC